MGLDLTSSKNYCIVCKAEIPEFRDVCDDCIKCVLDNGGTKAFREEDLV